MLCRVILVFCAFVFVVCERQGRFFSFEFEDRDLNVDLDFSIPFISIPIKRASDPFASGLPTININPASLALGGAMLLGTTVLLPLLMKNYAARSGYAKSSRLLENTDFSPDAVIKFASEMLTDGRGLRGCALRVACWTAQEHYESSKIIMPISKNKLLSMIVNSTAIEDAMISGRNGRDCESYTPCPIQNEQIPILMDSLAGFTKYYGLSTARG